MARQRCTGQTTDRPNCDRTNVGGPHAAINNKKLGSRTAYSSSEEEGTLVESMKTREGGSVVQKASCLMSLVPVNRDELKRGLVVVREGHKREQVVDTATYVLNDENFSIWRLVGKLNFIYLT